MGESSLIVYRSTGHAEGRAHPSAEEGSAGFRYSYHGPANDIPIWVNDYGTHTGDEYLSELIKSVHSHAVILRPV
jgi:hypothetical protein